MIRLFLLFVLISNFAIGAELDQLQQKRYIAIAKEVRCPTCVSESIYESDTMVANQIKSMIKEQIIVGRSDTEILDYLRTKYGDFIIFAPQFNYHTYILWCAPFLLLAVILLYLLKNFSKLKRYW